VSAGKALALAVITSENGAEVGQKTYGLFSRRLPLWQPGLTEDNVRRIKTWFPNPVGQAFEPDRIDENVRLESLTYGFATTS
jgi:hypothetical protein